MVNPITISIGEKDGYGKNTPLNKKIKAKTRCSNKFLCPQCGGMLEIWDVKDWNGKIFAKAYVCNSCDNFFSKEECDVK